MQRKTDDDERPEPTFNIAMFREDLGLAPEAPWQIVHDALLDTGRPLCAAELVEWYALPEPNSWITCDVLSTGDYGGAGDVGEANQRSLKEALPSEEWTEERGDYSSKQLWLLDNDSNRAIIEDLECNYPLYDDEELSKVQMEWEQAAWDDYGWPDLRRECRKYGRHTEEWEERVDSLTDAERLDLYREAMELANAYPTFEYNGACLPLDDIVSEFFDVTERKFRAQDGGFTHHPDQRSLPFPSEF